MNTQWKESLAEQLASVEVHATDRQLDQLIQYMSLILDRNQHINLTAIREEDAFLKGHYVDSAFLCTLTEYQRAETVLDMGTGAGFPGVPLAILSPEKQFTLVDSLAKRLRVIDEFADTIGITNVKTIHARAEDIGHDPVHREHYDLVVSRAVAELNTLSEYCLPLVKTGGWFIAYKGAGAQEELSRATKAIHVLGGVGEKIIPYRDDEWDHSLVVIPKEKSSPKKYPRKAGTPSKTPIR